MCTEQRRLKLKLKSNILLQRNVENVGSMLKAGGYGIEPREPSGKNKEQVFQILIAQI